MTWTWNSRKKLNLLGYLALSLLIVGCDLPELENEDAPLVEFNIQEAGNILLKELESVTLESVKVGQVVSYQSNYKVEIGGKNNFYAIGRKVTKINPDTTPPIIVMDETLTVYEGDSVVDQKTYDVIWEIKPETIISSNMFKSSSDDELSFKYYNLKTRRRYLKPSNKITKGRPDCGGLPNCTINALEIYYIVHLIQNEKVVDKQEKTIVLSADIPPLFWNSGVSPLSPDLLPYFPVAEECTAFMSSGAYIRQCLILDDLDKKE